MAMLLWRWMAYFCLLSINVATVVSERKCRTRFTCNRPTRDNVSSILFDKIHDDDDDVLSKISYNHGKKYEYCICIMSYCTAWCVRYIAMISGIFHLLTVSLPNPYSILT